MGLAPSALDAGRPSPRLVERDLVLLTDWDVPFFRPSSISTDGTRFRALVPLIYKINLRWQIVVPGTKITSLVIFINGVRSSYAIPAIPIGSLTGDYTFTSSIRPGSEIVFYIGVTSDVAFGANFSATILEFTNI